MISAFNEVLASQRRLEAAQNDGEAEKIKRTKSAEASAAAMTITAGGIAESRGIIAEGNAKALAAFRADTTLTDADAMAFMMEINRLEALRDAATHGGHRSEEHTSELQSLMRISYAVFCLKKKKK